MKVNLNDVARELTLDEGKVIHVSEAQVKELLGCLGRRWRTLGLCKAFAEFIAIIKRAGQRS